VFSEVFTKAAVSLFLVVVVVRSHWTATSMEFVEVGTLVVWTCRSSCRWKTSFASACVDSVERSVLAMCILPAKSAFSFTFGIARGAARRPPVVTAASFSLRALTGRAAVIDLLIVASLRRSTKTGERRPLNVFGDVWTFWLKSYSEIKQNVGFGNRLSMRLVLLFLVRR